MSNLIYNPTIPQTGTWFIIDLFKRLGFDIEHTGAALDKPPMNLNRNLLLSSHVFSYFYQPEPLKESWPQFSENGITTHVVRKGKQCLWAHKLLAKMHKTVIPVRDPLASILTRETRAPNLRHFYIVDGWCDVITHLAPNPNVFFFPVDLNLTFDERKELLVSVCIHCGIDPAAFDTVLGDVATHWKKQNVTANNPYKEAYAAGDIKELERLLGPKWAEVRHLKNMGGIIVPFLGKHRYNSHKTLIW